MVSILGVAHGPGYPGPDPGPALIGLIRAFGFTTRIGCRSKILANLMFGLGLDELIESPESGRPD